MKRAARTRGFILTTLALAVLAAAALGGLLLFGATLWYRGDLPPLDNVLAYRPRQHLQVFTADGVEIAQFGAERRIFVPIAQMPRRLRDAVLAVEDEHFYEHGGISWRGLARATLANLTGGLPQGASTITQQVARTFFLSTRRTPERKIKEALLARRIEGELSKDQILELYLNQIYLGQRAYGFGAAAHTYFGKPLDKLSLAETAMLAGLPQNPIHANPLASLERAQRRQRVVLARMRVVGAITAAEQQQALAEKLDIRSSLRPEVRAEHAAEMAHQVVFAQIGEKAYTEGIRVFTSLRADDQRAADEALRRALIAHERRQPWRGPEGHEPLPDDATEAERAAATALKEVADDDLLRVAIVLDASPTLLRLQLASGEQVNVRGEGLHAVQAAWAPKAAPALAIRRGSILRVLASGSAGNGEWSVVQWPQAQGAYVGLDPLTGRVRALVGGLDFTRQPFNHATSAWRQPGSAFKPFLYSAAFEAGVMPETRVDDAPLTEGDGTPANWSPRNADGRYDGEITVREAMVRSRNGASVRVLQAVGLAAARQWVQRFGFGADKLPDNLTFALGTGSTTPLQLAAAYAVFANGGHRVSPVLIERIVDAQGRVLFEAPPAAALSAADRVIPERNAFVVTSLLGDVTRRGTAARAQVTLRRPDLYGKTGTTDDAVDAWFAGFHPTAVGVAWIGYDTPRSLGDRESGGGLALPVWIDAMRPSLRDTPVLPAQRPQDGLVAAGGDWRYAEWADGGHRVRIGPAMPVMTEAAAGAASEPER